MNKHLNLRLHKIFETGSIAYLALPIIIFAYGWLQLYYAIPITVAVIYLLWKTYRLPQSKSANLFSFKDHKILLIISSIVLLGWVAISGIGGFATQTTDYNKHNAVMNDLIEKDWPVTYESDTKQEVPLVYYIGYYLPSAFIGKLSGSQLITHIAELLWAYLGIVFIFYWILRLIRRPSYIALAVLIFFSGADIIGHILLLTHSSSDMVINAFSRLEWYAGLGNIQFSGNTTLLFWVPQHALGGWLSAAIVLSYIVEKRRKSLLLFVFSITALWSPIVLLGLVLLLIAAWIAEGYKLRPFITFENIISVIVLCFPVFLYLISGGSAQPYGLFTSYSIQEMSIVQKCLALIAFIAVEFGALSLVLTPYVLKRETKEWKILFFTAISVLLLLTFIRYGIFNDLAMRASIPLLFVVMIIAIRLLGLTPSQLNFKLKAAACVILAFGIIVPLVEINTHTISPRKEMRDQVSEVWTSIGDPTLSADEKKFTAQYLGKDSSFFFTHLSR